MQVAHQQWDMDDYWQVNKCTILSYSTWENRYIHSHTPNTYIIKLCAFGHYMLSEICFDKIDKLTYF